MSMFVNFICDSDFEFSLDYFGSVLATIIPGIIMFAIFIIVCVIITKAQGKNRYNNQNRYNGGNQPGNHHYDPNWRPGYDRSEYDSKRSGGSSGSFSNYENQPQPGYGQGYSKPVNQGTRYCTSCGAKVDGDGAFCPHCGNRLK